MYSPAVWPRWLDRTSSQRCRVPAPRARAPGPTVSTCRRDRSWALLQRPTLWHSAAMSRSVIRAALLLLALTAAVVVAACGGSGGAEKTAKETLASVKPLPSAQVSAALRISFDNAPPEVGDKLELTFDGPLRNNGADKLPSLDWKIAFTGLTTRFTLARRLHRRQLLHQPRRPGLRGRPRGGRPARRPGARRQAEGRLRSRARPARRGQGRQEGGRVTVAGTKATNYTGTIDLDKAIDQYERLSQSLPTTGASAAVPQGRLTPEQRAQVKRTFGSPRFEAAVADDETVRRLVVTTDFTTPAVNREGAGGITGGHIEYRVEYSDVGEETTVVAPKDTQPIGDFARELQRILSRR